MDIRKITLVAGGDKGAEILFIRPEEKNGRRFNNEVKEKRKYPIHNDLDQLFKDLRYYLLDLTGIVRDDMDKAEQDFTTSDSEVKAIEILDDTFCIIGTKRASYGGRFKISTPDISQAHEYPHYEEVWEIIGKIKDETRQYMNGTKAISAEEAIVRQIENGRNKHTTPEDLAAMTPDERKELITGILEKEFGSTVTHMEDLEEIPEEEENETQVIDLAKLG